MTRWLTALLLVVGCGAAVPAPCSPEELSLKLAPIVAECKLRRETECKGYDVLDECPLIQQCDARLERAESGCK